MTGFSVGYLTALSYQGSNGHKSLWNVGCVCGKTVVLAATELKKLKDRGTQASCGCKRAETIGAKNLKHGMARHPAYAVWRSMLDRCRLPTHQAWANYGGRGITVCPAWQESFTAFWEDMGPTYAPGLTLDRKLNDSGYSPGNCHWTTSKAQANNTRANVLVGEETASQLAERTSVKRSTMYYRLSRGVPTERLTEPPDFSRKVSTS